ncbi:hypothetical protein D3C76_946790 [compost metagenome]
MQLLFQRAGTDNYCRVIQVLQGVEQDVQPFVVAHHTHKQKELIAKLLPPVSRSIAVRLWVTRLVQSIGDHSGLVLKLLQHITGVQVIRRCNDDPVGAVQKAIHQRSVKFEQLFLADNVRVVRHHAGFVQAACEMHQVHERPWKVVIDYVGLRCQLAKLFEDAPGKTRGGELNVEPGSMDFMLRDLHHRRCRIGTECQHLAFNAVQGAAFAQLENHLFDPADRVRQVRLEKMKNSHSTSQSLAVSAGRDLRAALPGKKPCL